MGGKLFIFALMCLIGYYWYQAWFKPEKLIEAKRKAQQRWGILSLFMSGTNLPDPVLIFTARVLPPLFIFWGLLLILLIE